jgi:heptosyltransferase III
MSEIKRILVVRTDRIGDLVLTLPMVDVLRMNYPDAHIAMLARRYTAELAGSSGNVDEVILYDQESNFVPFFKMLKLIRLKKFDVVFVAFPRMRLAILLWLAHIKHRVGSGFRLYSLFFNKRVYEHRKDAKKHELEYNLTLLEKFGCMLKKIQTPWIDVKEENILSVKSKLKQMGIDETDKLIIMHPGSGGSSRDWNRERFIELAKKITKLPNIKIILTGSVNETTLIQYIKNNVDAAVDMCGQFSLLEYAGLSKLAKLFIGNSTGTLHIAAAVGTPVISFFPHIKPMTPERWGPYTDKKKVFIPQNQPPDCKKCVNNKTNCECVDSISADTVFESVKEFLN